MNEGSGTSALGGFNDPSPNDMRHIELYVLGNLIQKNCLVPLFDYMRQKRYDQLIFKHCYQRLFNPQQSCQKLD